MTDDIGSSVYQGRKERQHILQPARVLLFPSAEGLDKLAAVRTMAQQILGMVGSFIASYSPVSAQDVKTVGCKVLESTMPRNVLRTVFGFTALTCAAVGVASIEDVVVQEKTWDIFGHVDPLIGTMDGGMGGPEGIEQ